jgi:hypothetical protein
VVLCVVTYISKPRKTQQESFGGLNMQKVIARSADGSTKMLALVQDLGATVMLCSLSREGQPDAIEHAIGFPKTDVSPVLDPKSS